MTNLLLKVIDESDKIDDFNCGDEDIDYFLKKLAIPNQYRKLSNTFVFLNQEDKRVVAYFSLLASQLNTGDARIYGIDKVPIVLLGRISVDKNFQGENIGRLMITIAIKKALKTGNFIACRLLLIETSIEMKDYYLEKIKLGFEWFKDRKNYSILVLDLLKYENSLK